MSERRLLTCPMCGGCFFTLHGIGLLRHPREFLRSRMTSCTNYITCEKCGREYDASSGLMLAPDGTADPWSHSLLVGGKTPRRVRRFKRREQERRVAATS